MNDVKKEKTVPLTSVGADDGQSNQTTVDSIPESEEKSKYDFKEMMRLQKELRKTLDPSYMKTVTMSELYDTAYLNKPATSVLRHDLRGPPGRECLRPGPGGPGSVRTAPWDPFSL